MKESVAIAKDANTKKEFSPTDNSIHRVRDEPERQLGSLRGVIGNITRDGGTPSVESIATELSVMPSSDRASALLALQQTHGNQYVQRVVTGIQAKLKVGQPGDVYEQEADRVADAVMQMPEPGVQRQIEEEEEQIQTRPVAERITPLVQRQMEEEEEPIGELEEEEGPIMTKALSNGTLQVTDSLRVRLNRSKDGGEKLSETDRNFMERRFDVDFSGVRIHTDSNAAQMSRNLSAQAFTIGRDIYFGAGRYTPGTSSGKKLLAHELTHTIQQAQGVVPSGRLQRNNETDEERLQRQGRETVDVMSRIIAQTDERGYDGIIVTITHNGRELVPGFRRLGSRGPRPAGTVPVSASSVAQRWMMPTITSILLSGQGRWQLDFIRDERGIMTLARVGMVVPRATSRLQPSSGPPSALPSPRGGSDDEAIIRDIRRTRQRILSTAAELIEQQNPARPENLLLSVGPLAVGRLARLRHLRRIGGLAAVVGRTGRSVFGELRFRGLIRNRPLRQLTHHEIYNAFRPTTFRPIGHTIMRLRHPRTRDLGMTTLRDVETLFNRGVIHESRGVASIQHGRLKAIVNVETGVIMTISPL